MQQVAQKVATDGATEKLAGVIGPKEKPELRACGDAIKDAGGAIKDVAVDVAQEALALSQQNHDNSSCKVQTLMQQFSQVAKP